jgi:hypothetical protein
VVGITCVSRAGQNPEIQPKPSGTEYCQRGVTLNDDNSLGTYRVMNAFGIEGWEVFSVVQEVHTAANWQRTFFTRRPLGHPGKSCKQINEELSQPSKGSHR